MKKIVLTLGALATAIAVVPMFAAFEAHVINVTATIENALSVPITPIQFGVVFPQETLVEFLPISLSQSFEREDRVDDVEYIIRQKPKCAWSWQDESGVWNIDESSTQTGHVNPVLDDPQTPGDESNGGTAYTIDCGEKENIPEDPNGTPPTGDGIPDNATWGALPMLCPYISKHERTPDHDPIFDGNDNDGSLPSFHKPFIVSSSTVSWTDVRGRLAKSAQDHEDNWAIDLSVPCFGGYCAQDWADFVHGINPDAGDPSQYTQPIDNEHKVFGCDLWVEVTGVSRTEED